MPTFLGVHAPAVSGTRQLERANAARTVPTSSEKQPFEQECSIPAGRIEQSLTTLERLETVGQVYQGGQERAGGAGSVLVQVAGALWSRGRCIVVFRTCPQRSRPAASADPDVSAAASAFTAGCRFSIGTWISRTRAKTSNGERAVATAARNGVAASPPLSRWLVYWPWPVYSFGGWCHPYSAAF